MKTNEISVKVLNTDAQNWIEKLRIVLLIQDKGKGTVKNYTGEMILLFKYYNSKTMETITFRYKDYADGKKAKINDAEP